MFLSLSFRLVFMFLSSLALPNIAHADYTWVTGSYQNKDRAIARVSDKKFMAIDAKIVPTKAVGFHFRVVAGRYMSKSDAYADRERILRSGAKGIWLMTIKPMVFISPVSRGKPLAQVKADIRQSRKTIVPPRHGHAVTAAHHPKKDEQADAVGQKEFSLEFTPKKWFFKGSVKKVAFTAGENPSIYFNDNNHDCRVLVKHYVDDLSEVRPPWRYGDYVQVREGDVALEEKRCHVAHVYEVIPK
jgi:hypothetical protein